MENHDDPTGPSVESDGLAFFYRDAADAFTKLSVDAQRLARRARRLGGAVGEDGIEPTEQERTDFHRACESAGRVAALTYRLISHLDLD